MTAEVAAIAEIGEVLLTRAHLDARLAAIRARVGAAAMPAPGSPEDRRLERWTVQVLVDEELIRQEARRIEIATALRPDDPLHPEVPGALFAAVTGDPDVEDAARAQYHREMARHRTPRSADVTQVVLADPAAATRLARTAEVLGLAEAARRLAVTVEEHTFVQGRIGGRLEELVLAAEPGTVVGPVATPLGAHVVEIHAVRAAATRPYGEVAPELRRALVETVRGRRFERWLLARRHERVRLFPGYEHPGDPRIPDAIHRH